MSDEHLERIEAKLDRVIAIQAEHTLTLSEHSAKLDDHSRRFEQIARRVSSVEVTLENNVPQAIRQIAEGHAMLQASMDRGFADMKKHIDDRMVPFEEAVRQHSGILKRDRLL